MAAKLAACGGQGENIGVGRDAVGPTWLLLGSALKLDFGEYPQGDADRTDAEREQERLCAEDGRVESEAQLCLLVVNRSCAQAGEAEEGRDPGEHAKSDPC